MGVERIRIKGLWGRVSLPPAPQTVAVRFSSGPSGHRTHAFIRHSHVSVFTPYLSPSIFYLDLLESGPCQKN